MKNVKYISIAGAAVSLTAFAGYMFLYIKNLFQVGFTTSFNKIVQNDKLIKQLQEDIENLSGSIKIDLEKTKKMEKTIVKLQDENTVLLTLIKKPGETHLNEFVCDFF